MKQTKFKDLARNRMAQDRDEIVKRYFRYVIRVFLL